MVFLKVKSTAVYSWPFKTIICEVLDEKQYIYDQFCKHITNCSVYATH